MRTLDTSLGTDTGHFRVLDSWEEGISNIAHEVKTGDGRLDARMRTQIRKDGYLKKTVRMSTRSCGTSSPAPVATDPRLLT